MADDPRPILRSLAASDRRGAVWCAALCAQSVLHLVPSGEDRPARAVRLALDYGRGIDVPLDRLREAADAAYDAYAASYAPAAADSAAAASRAASRAAAYAASPADAAATAAGSAAAYAASRAAAADADASDDAWDAAHAAWLASLAALVRGQTTPVAPTFADVQRARPEAQVAWDWLLEHSPEPVRVGSLGEALDRARRLGLRWEFPVERALAERARDEDVVVAILTGRAA